METEIRKWEENHLSVAWLTNVACKQRVTVSKRCQSQILIHRTPASFSVFHLPLQMKVLVWSRLLWFCRLEANCNSSYQNLIFLTIFYWPTIDQATAFYKFGVLPELMGKWYSKIPTFSGSDSSLQIATFLMKLYLQQMMDVKNGATAKVRNMEQWSVVTMKNVQLTGFILKYP